MNNQEYDYGLASLNRVKALTITKNKLAWIDLSWTPSFNGLSKSTFG